MERKHKILIVDDDPAFCKLKSLLLESNGYSVKYIIQPNDVFLTLKTEVFDLVLLDLCLGKVSGIDILKQITALYNDIPVIMITAYATIENAVTAIKEGAYDYISKNYEDEDVIIKIKHALEKRTDTLRIKNLEDALHSRFSLGNILGSNEKMQEIYRLIETVCETDVTVLITGETGTGKELIARAIHFNSLRRKNSFMAINCAAIQEDLMESELFGHEKGSFTGAVSQKMGKLETADGGTVFLDEIGDLPLPLQAKLLRFLQDRTFDRVGGTEKISSDVRIISATNRNLHSMIGDNLFREDLFYRINVVEITLPPLRDRMDDLPLLLSHFLQEANKKFNKRVKSLSKDAFRIFGAYHWPGNIRELEHLVEKLVLLCKSDTITEQEVGNFIKLEGQSISFSVPTSVSISELRDKVEKDYIIMLLRETDNNVSESARRAGLTRKSMYEKMRAYGLGPKK